MSRITDPPDLVRTLAYMRRQLRRLPLDHPQREEKLRWLAELFRLSVTSALQHGTLRERLERLSPGLAERLARLEATTPEDTLREAGVSSRRQATYRRKFSTLLAGRAKAS